MIRFIRELRRREVFRTLGLYVGVCWILIEASSILLPVFEAPEWALRGLIILAIVGFPVTAALAWIYDVTARGIEVQAEPTDTVVPALGGRKADFVVIGVLSIALVFSVYLNVTGGLEIAEELDPVSILIADFNNSTGESLFDGLLEQALNIGIEGAPHVTSYDRLAARTLAEELQPDAGGLAADVARLVAVREGVNLVLSGSVAPTGQGFRLALAGLDPVSGDPSFEVSTDVSTREDVLAAVGSLAEAVREELGDETLTNEATAETFTAASIEAASTYMDAIELAYDGRHEEAIERFKAATELDPNLGRAFSGWALSEFKLGRNDEAAVLWDRALSLMGTMTERERLRTLGVYYANGTRNYEKAVESFTELVDKYPADAAGLNNLAVSAFLTLDFTAASEYGRRVLDIYPTSRLYRVNYALYAMYSGDFDAAATQSRAGVENDPEYGMFYLPLAISHLANGDYAAARETYERMFDTTTSEHRGSVARLGLADVSIYMGQLEQARAELRDGIEQDMAENALNAAAVKHIALAETFLADGDYAMATAAVADALDLSQLDSIRTAAALILFEAGDEEAASNLADELSVQLNTHSRAYAMMIEGMLQSQAGEHVDAIQTLRLALDLADLWRIRYELGRAYLDGGFFAEAFDEFENCFQRRGEATAMFLDDTPTFRYLADLPYWLARAQEGLGMQSDAAENYQVFLRLRPQGGPLADDARQRLP